MATLKGKRIAILAADGFEEVELTKPKEALEKAGAKTVVVSLKSGKIQGMNHDQKGDKVKVDKTVDEVTAAEFDNLVLPGGVQNPDYLRVSEQAVAFVRDFVAAGKTVAAICHGPWTLIEAGAVKGKKITSWPSLKTDLTNAGAKWVDEEVVSDGGLITSRNPSDIPAFNKQIIAEFAEGVKLKQAS